MLTALRSVFTLLNFFPKVTLQYALKKNAIFFRNNTATALTQIAWGWIHLTAL